MDYISREAAIHAILEYHDAYYPAWFAGVIKRVPSAAIPIRKHGQWVQKKHKSVVFGMVANELDFTCSVCGKFWFHNGEMIKKYLFCPHCGADMRAEKEN